jgi:hypothetical protein
LGGGGSLRIAFSSLLPVSSGISLSIFFCRNKKTKQNKKIKAVAEKPNARFSFPSATLLFHGAKRIGCGWRMGSVGAVQCPHACKGYQEDSWMNCII